MKRQAISWEGMLTNLVKDTSVKIYFPKEDPAQEMLKVLKCWLCGLPQGAVPGKGDWIRSQTYTGCCAHGGGGKVTGFPRVLCRGVGGGWVRSQTSTGCSGGGRWLHREGTCQTPLSEVAKAVATRLSQVDSMFSIDCEGPSDSQNPV